MKIKNLLFQPVTLHLYNGKGLHLNAREVRDIPVNQISGEIRQAAVRGLVSIIDSAGRQASHNIADVNIPDLAETAIIQAESVTNPKKGIRK
ncbi:MAG: hypothetical protein ACYC27_19695 [Armatimonadota bacterium]